MRFFGFTKTQIAILASFFLVSSIFSQAEERPHVVIIHGEPEYGSAKTMPQLAKQLEERFDFKTTVLKSDKPEMGNLPDLSVLDEADLLILYIRFRIATDAQFERLKKWFDEGKPAVAFRTTSHGFWEDKGWFVPFFGGHYKAHANNSAGTTVSLNSRSADHPILRGIDGQFHIEYGGTYNAQPLSDFTTPLLFGKTGDLPSEPVAWVSEYKPGQRLFYTSLGAEDNFKNESFENLVLNSVLWCLDLSIPEGGELERGIANRSVSEVPIPEIPIREFSEEAKILFTDAGDIGKWKHYDPSVEPLAVGLDGRADTTIGGPVFDDARWKEESGTLKARPGYGDIVTKQSLQNGVYHIDFLIPEEPDYTSGNFRGNSGVYINGKWEIQIIDSWGKDDVDEFNTCGAIMGVAAPLVNASDKPGTWQKLEVAVNNIDSESAEISAWLNGKQIHDSVLVNNPTIYGFGEGIEEEDEDEDSGPSYFGIIFKEDESIQADYANNFTSSIRFKSGGDSPLFSKFNPEAPYSNASKSLFVYDGRIVFSQGNKVLLQSDIEIDDEEWHQVTISHRDGELNLSIDGRQNQSTKTKLLQDDNEALVQLNLSHEDFPWNEAWDDSGERAEIDSYSFSSKSDPEIEWQRGSASAIDLVSGEAGQALDMGSDFTAFARFRTESGGALLSKAPAEGIWQPNGKVLFVSEGNLVFDIGWVGEIRSNGVEVDDGEWHIATVSLKDDEMSLYIDGEKVAERGGFQRPDPEEFVFKVGACSTDFPDGFYGSFEGEISNAGYIKASLSEQEISKILPGTTNFDSWQYYMKPDLQSKQGPKYSMVIIEVNEEEEEEFDFEQGIDGNSELIGGPLRLQADTSEVRFANIAVEPLREVDHAGIIASWEQSNIEKGERVYNLICITCHGNLEKEGSLPTSRKFWEAEFKNGRDPYSLFKTLETGFGQMPPNPQLSAQQKYDVIHYIREKLVKPTNRKEYFEVDNTYLAGLPKGLSKTGKVTQAMLEYAKGPKYQRMNFGPMLNWTYQVAPGNIAYKGIAIRLDKGPGGVSKGNAWLLYDHDTMRVAAAWSGAGFIDWKGIAFDQSHGTHASIVGDIAYVNPVGPGWANPATGSWKDPRFLGRDGKPYGPLPREWVKFKGQYINGERVVITYTVGDTAILESPGMELNGSDVIYTRTLNISKSNHDLRLRVAPENIQVATAGNAEVGELTQENGFNILNIPKDQTPLKVKILTSTIDEQKLIFAALLTEKPEDLSTYTNGGPEQWTETVTTQGIQSQGEGPFEVDEIVYPSDNPWNSWMRIGGFDFFEDGRRAAVATWLGDVWIVDGIDKEFGNHNWKRITTGLFQPLGVKIVDDVIYVTCRDQIARLHDLNGDYEIDYIECFNNDHQVTEHFHEFAMGLQTDDKGNFYYAKSARHAKTALVPHHGTLLRVSPDGSRTDIIAKGFRAANGVCINPDGTFIVTDQEGNWNPKNRINYVNEGGFYGNMWGFHEVTDQSDDAMEQPLCWITNAFDRSPGELVWVPENAKWGSLNGSLLNLSYGMGRVFVVPHEVIDGQAQGGMVSLGLDFPTGVMRGRFHPENGQLYTAGMFAWAGNKSRDGGFYRIRRTQKPATLPIALQAYRNGVLISFSEPVDIRSAALKDNYQVKAWDLKRTSDYGSEHYNEHKLTLKSAKVLKGGRSVFLAIPDIHPTWGMEIKMEIKGKDGKSLERKIHNTIHSLNTNYLF